MMKIKKVYIPKKYIHTLKKLKNYLLIKRIKPKIKIKITKLPKK